jgi:hypothetical protein
MKSRILMYLFVFSVLLIIFQYVNSKHIIDKYEEDIKTFKTKITDLEENVVRLEDEKIELGYFSIDNNEDALTYFENQGFDVSELKPILIDGLLEMNTYQGVDHPIIPYASMTESKILINKVKVLNHKWIIANFTDGKYWGELFINYFIEASGKVNYELKDSFLYPVN